jgi:hypothetical protein
MRTAAATASLPSFSVSTTRCLIADHDLTVRAVADAKDAFHASIIAATQPAFKCVGLGFRLARGPPVLAA